MATGRRSEAKTKRRKPLPNLSELTGSVCIQWRKSGDTFRPYHYRFWREGGRLRKQYVKLEDAEKVKAACDSNRRKRKAWRTELLAAKRQYRLLVELLKREALGV